MARDKSGRGPNNSVSARAQDRPERPAQRGSLQDKGIAAAHMYRFSAPIPPPDMVEHYNEIHPGASDIFFTAWGDQREHRMELEKLAITAGIRREREGLWLGALIAILIILGGFYLILSDKDGYGFAAILGTITAVVGAFLYAKHQESIAARDQEE